MAEPMNPRRIVWTWERAPGARYSWLLGRRNRTIVARYDPGAMSGLADVLNGYEERLADAIAEVDRCHETGDCADD